VVEAWGQLQRDASRCYADTVSGYLPERIRRTVSLQADRISDRCDQLGALHLGPGRLTPGASRAV
jgi:hypothetical protein